MAAGANGKGGGPADGGSPQTHEIRFRGYTPDGRVTVSEPVALLPAFQPPPRMGLTWFGHGAYVPGDQASLVAVAEGVSGAAVKFIIDRQGGVSVAGDSGSDLPDV